MAQKFLLDDDVLKLDYLDNNGNYKLADYLDSLMEESISISVRLAANNYQTTSSNKDRINHYIEKIKSPLTNLVELKNI